MSRWTRYRKKKDALNAGDESGASDLSDTEPSSDSDSDRQQPAPKRGRKESSSSSSESDDSSQPSGSGDENADSQDEEEEMHHGEDDEGEQNGGQIVDEVLVGGDPEDNLEVPNNEGNDGEAGQQGPQQDEDDDSSVDENDNDIVSDSSSDEETSSESENESDDESDESDESDVDYEGGNAPNGDIPLYANARISVMESIIMILTLSITFSLSGACLAKILELIELHCPPVNNCITSLYKFKQLFIDIGRNCLVLHYYCERCFKKLQNKNSICNQCNNETKVAFFVEVPILNQLQRMFLRPGFLEMLMFRFNGQKKDANNFEDIYDGRLYKENMGEEFQPGHYNISFMFYTDGISIFKSSKFSVWPVFLVINELNYKTRTRKENILLAALWFGKSKPKPNLFLKPLQKTCRKFRDGVQLNVPNGPPVSVKATMICMTCDLQAKGIFLRQKLSNGYYGCSKCLSRGVRIPVGRSSVHVHQHIRPQQMQLRKNNEVRDLALNKQFGYKGISLLYFLMPSMVAGTCIDIMHQIFSGLSKLLVKLWFDPSFSGQPYSCTRMIDIVNERLSSIVPPSFVERFTRTLTDRKLWKSKEYKLWFFYYSIVVMQGILEDVYLDHHIKLVSALSLLSLDSISPDQIDSAEELLLEYIKDFQNLYGLRYMGMNVHMLAHLCDMVRDLGPLWVYSCFFLEALNGQIIKLVHSPFQPALQICSSASLFLSLNTKIDSLLADSVARNFCVKLRSGAPDKKIVEHINDKLKIVGRPAFQYNVSAATIQVLMNRFNVANSHFQSFFRLRKSGIVYTSEKQQATKRCSMYASFVKDGVPFLGKIRDYVRVSTCVCTKICLCMPARYFCVVQIYERIPWRIHDVQNVRISYLTAVAPTDNVLAFTCDELQGPCFYMKTNNFEYLATRVNRLEYE
ncbi:uncharacterized protein LOC117642364 [Thrips palmi]|uniref:Uncharacterized protein LOC117642364 n=1 Tax=Thrips palmi TaxID=161013 RepID=A0A6P8YI93_THRPL|nr:uncharacterized protein LOC117642364 [Thrips palmi]